jgi:hypothetical protein
MLTIASIAALIIPAAFVLSAVGRLVTRPQYRKLQGIYWS